jgi:TatA/E family protein of Tat protein translocase
VVLALIVFGPAKLPEIMGQVGKAINDFRRATSELSDEFNRTIQAELQETRAVIEDTKAVVADAHATFTGLPAPTRTASPDEALPAVTIANGISSDSFSNGTVSTSMTPPLADTTQWSWETSAPTTPTTPTTSPPTTQAAATEPPPAKEPNQERAAHDELLPPY